MERSSAEGLPKLSRFCKLKDCEWRKPEPDIKVPFLRARFPKEGDALGSLWQRRGVVGGGGSLFSTEQNQRELEMGNHLGLV